MEIMKLTPQQEKAVRHMGPALVVAGAGSGKTRTLTAKIAWLIENGYRPENILAITFTNKAADEMKRRLVAMTGLSLDRFPWVRTYHSACFQILKRDCGLLGYVPPLQIYSDYQQQKILKELLIRYNLDRKYLYPLRAAISNAKNSGNPESYFDAHPRLGNVRLAEIYRDYEALLRKKNAVDFDNILLMTRNLLRDHENVRKRYNDLFSYVLVDEYQDTNDLQADLTKYLVSDGNYFCVGDDWQAIYGFRGSNLNHFLTFQKSFPNARIFRLEQNFRSAHVIVETAGRLITHNRLRMDKTCFSEKKGGNVRVLSFFSDDEESSWVADEIKRLNRTEGIGFENMAVLYRTKFCSLPYERVFRMAGIPYQMLGGKGFYERKEIMDINCYLLSAVFEKDDAAFERIINTPRRGIGPKMLNTINNCRKDDEGLLAGARRAVREKMLTPKVHRALSDLLGLIEDIRDKKPDDAIIEVLEKTGYETYLKDYSKSPDEFTARMENIEQLIHAASGYKTILDYLEEAALIREDREEDGTGLGVNLATIHASKGLEFKVVFVIGCEENLLPHWKSMETEQELSEERRLMYVAMTRAESHLYITSAGYRKGQYNPPSRFIDEIREC